MSTLFSLWLVTTFSFQSVAGIKTGRLIGVAGSSDEGIYEINIDTGAATKLFEPDGLPTGEGLAVSPDGTLYGAFSADTDELAIIDVENQTVSFIGPFGFEDVSGLEFDKNGTLIGYDDVGTCQFLKIDPNTGTADALFEFELFGIGLGAILDGAMYAVGHDFPDEPPALRRVSLANQTLLHIGQLKWYLDSAGGLAFIGSTAYVSADDIDGMAGLYTADLETGEATFIGFFSGSGALYMIGLALLPGAGDADRDGDVDEGDVAYFSTCFGDLDDPEKSPYCAFLDADKDGDLDCTDWEAFIPNWTEDTDPPTFEPCDAEPPCEGDVNADFVVDPLDSGYVLSRFNCPVGQGDALCDAADANLDGLVDPLDVGYVLSRFGACE